MGVGCKVSLKGPFTRKRIIKFVTALTHFSFCSVGYTLVSYILENTTV